MKKIEVATALNSAENPAGYPAKSWPDCDVAEFRSVFRFVFVFIGVFYRSPISPYGLVYHVLALWSPIVCFLWVLSRVM